MFWGYKLPKKKNNQTNRKKLYTISLRIENHKHFSKTSIHFVTFHYPIVERALASEILLYRITLHLNTIKTGAL